MYKWQVFLGGVASATVVLASAGAAMPALAQTVTSSPLTSVSQAGSDVTANVCDMAGNPLSGEMNSATAGLTGQSCTGSSSTTPQTTGSAQNASTPAGLTSMTTALPGLSAVTGEIPGLGSMSSTLSGLNPTASQAPAQSPATGLTSAPNSTPLSDATVPSLSSNQPSSNQPSSNQPSSNQPSSNGGTVQNTLNGVTGTLPVSSLTGGLPNLGNVTGVLSGVSGPQS